MRPIIETVVFLGRQNIPLRGHRDDGLLGGHGSLPPLYPPLPELLIASLALNNNIGCRAGCIGLLSLQRLFYYHSIGKEIVN